MLDPQSHQVGACELLADQPKPIRFTQLPRPGKVIVGNALVRKVPVGLLAAQDILTFYGKRKNYVVADTVNTI